MNFSVTYRVDSDLMMIYGAMVDIKTRKLVAPARNIKWKDFSSNFYDEKLLNMTKYKTNDLVWMSSNCETYSYRDALSKTLSKYIQVDNLGLCGVQ